MVLRGPCGARDWIQGYRKQSKYSRLLSHVSSPLFWTFFWGVGGGKGSGIGLGIPLALHSGSTSDGFGGTIMGCRGLNPGQHRTRKIPYPLCYAVLLLSQSPLFPLLTWLFISWILFLQCIDGIYLWLMHFVIYFSTFTDTPGNKFISKATSFYIVEIWLG